MLLLLAVGITLCVVAWGYLVYAAIDFGSAARHEDDASAWGYLAVAAVGAVACLFLGFMLVARFSRTMGLTRSPSPSRSGTRVCTRVASAPLGEQVSPRAVADVLRTGPRVARSVGRCGAQAARR